MQNVAYEPKQVLITNAYNWYNKEDASIMIAMIISLKKLWPRTKITVMSLTPELCM
jgi:polysaccharide pyruvyl transferase WcaK-like protein